MGLTRTMTLTVSVVELLDILHYLAVVDYYYNYLKNYFVHTQQQLAN